MLKVIYAAALAALWALSALSWGHRESGEGAAAAGGSGAKLERTSDSR